MEAYLGALSSLTPPPPPHRALCRSTGRCLQVTQGRWCQLGKGQPPFPQSFPLGPEPGLMADSWLGAGVFCCFVLGRAWRGRFQLQGGGWEGGGPCTPLPFLPVLSHVPPRLVKGHRLRYPNGSLPATRELQCSCSREAGVKLSCCLGQACGVGTACPQLPQWSPRTWSGHLAEDTE